MSEGLVTLNFRPYLQLALSLALNTLYFSRSKCLYTASYVAYSVLNLYLLVNTLSFFREGFVTVIQKKIPYYQNSIRLTIRYQHRYLFYVQPIVFHSLFIQPVFVT